MAVFLDLAPSDDAALIDAASGKSLSFRELLRQAGSVAEPLGPARQLLFAFCRTDVATPVAFLGAVLAGHAVALLDADAGTGVSAELVDAYRPPWLVGPRGLADAMRSAGVRVASVAEVSGRELVRTGYPSPPLHPDLAVLLATSGTTGSRKFVRLTRRNLEANASSIATYLGLGSEDRPMASLPFHYSFGLSVLDSHWLVGAPVVVPAHGVLQRAFWTSFREHECTSLAGVPYTYQMLERIGFREMELPSLRALQQAGGALDRRLTELYGRFMEERGGRFYVMYGQTEATARIAYVPPERLGEKLGSAGIPVPGGRLSIDGAEGGADGSGTGEVIYEGPNVMMGYAAGPDDLARGDELGGVLRTGDIGYLDPEGFLFLVGRSKRIAKVYGLRVNLDEIEQLVREHGPAAVVAGDEAIVGYCAFGTDEEVAALATRLAARFRLNPRAIRLTRVGAIPTTTSGKVDYGVVQAWAGEAAGR